DLFSEHEIDRSLLDQVRRGFGNAEVSPLVNNVDELTVLVDGVKVSFLRYPFPVHEPFVRYEKVSLLSVREIAMTKAYTVGRRGSYKDYVDLYFVIAENQRYSDRHHRGSRTEIRHRFQFPSVSRTACISGRPR